MLVAFCWTKLLLCNVATFTGMLLYSESTLQLWSSRRFCEVFKEVYFSSLSAVRTMWYSVRTLISQQHPSGHPSVSRSFEQFKVASVRTLFRVREDPSVPVHPSGRRGYVMPGKNTILKLLIYVHTQV